MSRRRDLLGARQSNVHFVSALVGDGASWITTEEHIDRTVTMSCRFIKPSFTKVMILFGVSSTYNISFQNVFLNGMIRFDLQTSQRLSITEPYDDGEEHTIAYSAISGDVQYDGVVKGNIDSTSLANEAYQRRYLTLYGQNSGDENNYNIEAGTICNAAIAEFVMAKNGKEVVHLLPALKDGIPCMYDTIKNVYRYNKGTGTFSYIP